MRLRQKTDMESDIGRKRKSEEAPEALDEERAHREEVNEDVKMMAAIEMLEEVHENVREPISRVHFGVTLGRINGGTMRNSDQFGNDIGKYHSGRKCIHVDAYMDHSRVRRGR